MLPAKDLEDIDIDKMGGTRGIMGVGLDGEEVIDMASVAVYTPDGSLLMGGELPSAWWGYYRRALRETSRIVRALRPTADSLVAIVSSSTRPVRCWIDPVVTIAYNHKTWAEMV